MDKHLFWLASYPKSGNTLLRSILTALFFTNDGVFSLDKLKNINQFESTLHVFKNKDIFGDDFDKIGKTSLFYKYLLKLQTKEILRFKEDFIFLKTHSGLYEIANNPFTVSQNTRGIIYIIRDPRDVCISWSKHLGVSIDKTISNMTDPLSSSFWNEPKQVEYFEDKKRPKSFLSSWDKHVLSWTNVKWKTPLKVIRYEDLVYNKIDTIREIINFFTINFNFNFKDLDTKIKNILSTTDFQKLKKEEKEKGFIESGNNDFFSIGKKEQWKNILNNNQIKMIEKRFFKVMKNFNYELSS